MKLNLGSGIGPTASHFFALGYDNIDRQQPDNGHGKEVYPLDYPNDSAEIIRASHVLEHLSFRQTMDILRDWVRVLKPGGVLKLAVPDFEWIARKYLRSVDEAAPNENVTGYLMGGQIDENDYHKAIFDRRGLKAGMEAAGLVDVKPWESDAQDCSALPVSLNLQGTKPIELAADFKGDTAHVKIDTEGFRGVKDGQPYSRHEAELPAGTIQFEPETIGCVLSVPRLGFMSNMQCLLTVANLGIQVRMQQGAFWGQCLTEAILQFMEHDQYKYILTVDYDSIFTADDVLALYRYMASPGAEFIHALTTVQVRRENDNILLTMADHDGNSRGSVGMDEMQRDVVRVRTAHFGLTMFRVDALKRLPHPWFLDVPDEEGKWGEGKLDCDISYWVKWRECGNSLYLAPRVAIGHLEQVVSWPTETLESKNQRMKDYQKVGKPDWAWK